MNMRSAKQNHPRNSILILEFTQKIDPLDAIFVTKDLNKFQTEINTEKLNI